MQRSLYSSGRMVTFVTERQSQKQTGCLQTRSCCFVPYRFKFFRLIIFVSRYDAAKDFHTLANQNINFIFSLF